MVLLWVFCFCLLLSLNLTIFCLFNSSLTHAFFTVLLICLSLSLFLLFCLFSLLLIFPFCFIVCLGYLLFISRKVVVCFICSWNLDPFGGSHLRSAPKRKKTGSCTQISLSLYGKVSIFSMLRFCCHVENIAAVPLYFWMKSLNTASWPLDNKIRTFQDILDCSLCKSLTVSWEEPSQSKSSNSSALYEEVYWRVNSLWR